MFPLPPAASFQKPPRWCAPHTPAHSAFQTQTRWCASHTPSCSTFQIPARRCASHTLSRSTFQTQTRWCGSHTLSHLAFQMWTSSVQPTHRSIRAFLSPPIIWGGFFPAMARMMRCEIHTPLCSSWHFI